MLAHVELELGALPVFFVLPCRGYSIASQGRLPQSFDRPTDGLYA